MRPWIRLDVAYDETWLFGEDELVRFAWECFLRYAKRNSTGGGRVAVIPLASLAHSFRFRSLDPIRRMIEVAKLPWVDDDNTEHAPALSLVGSHWVINNWAEYQTLDAERMRNARAKQNGSEPLRTVRNDSEHHTHDKDKTRDIDAKASSAKRASKPRKENAAWDPVNRVLAVVYAQLGWPAPKPLDITTNLKAGSPVRVLIDEYGEDGAAKMFLFAHSTWPPGKATFPAVARNRAQLAEQMKAPANGKVALPRLSDAEKKEMRAR